MIDIRVSFEQLGKRGGDYDFLIGSFGAKRFQDWRQQQYISYSIAAKNLDTAPARIAPRQRAAFYEMGQWVGPGRHQL